MKKTIQKCLFILFCVISVIAYYQTGLKQYLTDRKQWNEVYMPMYDEFDSLESELILLDTIAVAVDSTSIQFNKERQRSMINRQRVLLSTLKGPEGPSDGFENALKQFPLISFCGGFLFIAAIFIPIGTSVWHKN